MYTLFVSYDCGVSYHAELSGNDIDALRPRMAECDEKLLRYYLEEDGEICFDEICGIHAHILAFMESARERERER